jgi:putative addiction module killer protein
MFQVQRYQTVDGRNLYGGWIGELRDRRAAARIMMRIDRLAAGNFGDCKPVGGGVWELRIDYGPGYRVYYAMADKTCVLLLCGGDKRKQSTDIERAVECWQDYQERTKP